MTRVPRRAALPLLVPLAFVWVACGEAPTNPLVIDVAPPTPAYAVDGEGGGGSEGDLPLPVPGSNLISFGNVWPFHVVDYNAYDFVYVRVSGSISTTPIGCSGNGPTGTFGPWGHPVNASFLVRIVNQAGYLFVPDQATQGTQVMTVRGMPEAAGSVMVGRTGGGATCLEYVNDKPIQKAGLAVSGSQTIHYEVYPVAELSVDPTFVVSGAGTILSATSHWDIVDPVWVYQLGDTLPAGRGPRWGKELCRGDLSCPYVPEQSGRVYLTGKVHGLDVQVWGPIVWVRESIPDACALPPSGAASAPLKADGPYAGPVCPPDPPQEEELEVEVRCVDAASDGPTVTRGLEVQCRAMVRPESVIASEVSFRWTFGPDPAMPELADLAPLEPVATDGVGLDAWTGVAVQSGSVSVTVRHEDDSASAGARMEVVGRSWAGRFPYPEARPEARVSFVNDAGEKELDPVPAFLGPKGVDEWPDGAAGKYILKMRPGGMLDQVPDGPNKGYNYVAGHLGSPSWLEADIFVSPALYPGHPFYEAQRGGPVSNIHSPYTRYCSRGDMDKIRDKVLRHEGAVPASGSHHDVTVKFYNETHDVGPLLEEVVVQFPPPSDPEYLRVVTEARATILNALVLDPGYAHNKAVVDSNSIGVQCKLRYPSNSGGAR